MGVGPATAAGMGIADEWVPYAYGAPQMHQRAGSGGGAS